MSIEGCITAEDVLVADHDCLRRACGSTCIGKGEAIVRFAYYGIIIDVLKGASDVDQLPEIQVLQVMLLDELFGLFIQRIK